MAVAEAEAEAKEIKTGERYFLGKHAVIVVEDNLAKTFRLARCRYLDNQDTFWVDIGALSTEPDNTPTISLGLFARRP